jgi:hypothetical protein
MSNSYRNNIYKGEQSSQPAVLSFLEDKEWQHELATIRPSIIDKLETMFTTYNVYGNTTQDKLTKAGIVPKMKLVECINSILRHTYYFPLYSFLLKLNELNYGVDDFNRVSTESGYVSGKEILTNINEIQDTSSLLHIITNPLCTKAFKGGIEPIITRFFSNNADKAQYGSNRKLTSSDFPLYAFEQMTLASCKQMLQFIQEYHIVTHISKDFLSIYAAKLIRQDKYFYIDTPNKTFTEQEIDSIKRSTDVTRDLRDASVEFSELCRFWKEDPFMNMLDRIIQEMDLVEQLVKLNVLFLDRKYEEAMSAAEHMLRGTHTNERYKSFGLISQHQKCLFSQVMSACLDPTYNKRFPQEIKNIAQMVVDNSKQFCEAYYTEQGNVVCDHETFTYYVYTKWMDAFTTLLMRYEKLSQQDVQSKSANYFLNMSNVVLNPKDSFCNRCYTSYKNMETKYKPSSNINTASIDVKFLLLKYTSMSYLFRMRYTDMCDIPEIVSHRQAYLKHREELNTSVSHLEDMIQKVLSSLKFEMTKSRKYLEILLK